MKLIILITVFLLSLNLKAQQIKGIVVSQETGKPIGAASVFFDNTTIATKTDNKGVFVINIPNANKKQLVVTAEGYDYFIVTSPTPNQNLKISLKTDDNLLEELIIDKNAFSRKEYLKAFRHFFIGDTPNAKKAKIVNEKDIYFSYDTKSFVFKAYCDKPIIINNSNLGYTIHFYLESFQVQFNHQTLNPENYVNSNYFGYSLFKENEKIDDKIIANRTESYNNSSVSFFNDLITSNLENSDYVFVVKGFSVNVDKYLKVESNNDDYKLCVIKIPTRKRVDLSSFSVKNGTLNFKSAKDSTAKEEVPFVVYNKETKEQSQLYFQQKCVLLQKDGHLLNPNDIYFSGFFANIKTADMLPIDYVAMKRPAKKPTETSKNKEMPTYEVFEKQAMAFYSSKNFIAHSKARKTFFDKLKVEYDYKEHEPFQLWIEENLKNTLFASEEEAITLHGNFVSTFKLIKDQKEDIESKEDHFSKLYGEKEFGKMYYNKVIQGVLSKLVNRENEEQKVPIN